MTVRIVVQGRVQGVGFRFYVARRAEEMGVTGSVWNRTDGAVEIIASADETTLATFEHALRAGPGSVASVSSMNSDDPVTGSFSIDRSRNA